MSLHKSQEGACFHAPFFTTHSHGHTVTTQTHSHNIGTRNYDPHEKRARPPLFFRDNRILRDAAGQIVPFDREDMRNTTNLTGAGMYYSPETMTWHPHRGILQVLLAWGVATIQ